MANPNSEPPESMEKINREILKSEDPLVSFLLSPAIDGKTSEQIADIYNDTHTPRIPVNKSRWARS